MHSDKVREKELKKGKSYLGLPMTFPPTFPTKYVGSPRSSRVVVHIDSSRSCALRY